MKDKPKTNHGYTVEHISMKDMKKEMKRRRSRVFACIIQPAKTIIQTIPEKYRQFNSLFDKAKGPEALPKHQPWDHEIPIQEGKQPTFGPVYSCSEKELAALREYLEENLAKGSIRESCSSAGYPILFVPKKNGKLRLCVDYRQLNSITIKNRYPLPRIDETIDKINGATYFTKLDLQGAYSLVRMKEGEEWKTTFRTRYSLYKYLVMPMGLTNAPTSFQALINNTLHPYLDNFCVAYLDDILIYSKSQEDHDKHVKLVLDQLQKHHLRIDLEKSEFDKDEIEFLGHIIGIHGIRMDPKKVKAILQWPTPQNLKELQAFLGLANYYRRFVAHYSKFATPLHRFTKKAVPFIWDKSSQDAFDLLKQKFTSAPVLIVFDPTKPIYMETDASDYALGVCLNQKDDQGRLHPVAFLSRKFTPAELNYQIHDKELMAIVAACEEWRHYLEGARFPITVYTDHKNLVYFMTTKALNRRQVRWWETLSPYDLHIVYRAGKDNIRADAISRRPDYLREKEPVSHAILTQEKDYLTINQANISANLTIIANDLETNIKKAYGNDTMAQNILQDPLTHFDITPNDLIQYKGLIYVTGKQNRDQILHDYHDSLIGGHQGIDRMYDRISENYYWPSMKKQVNEYIRNCDLCRKSKAQRHAPYGHLQPIETPESPWETIAWDFIVKLPQSTHPISHTPYDSLLVVTDNTTKQAVFEPWKEEFGPEHLAYLFLKAVYKLHGLPTKIISDRGTVFDSKFWLTLSARLGIKNKMYTA